MEIYTPERFEEISNEYDRRMEEHRQRISQLQPKTWKILSSKDANQFYTVTQNMNGSFDCECKGFTYRNSCSHINKVKEMLK